MNQGILSVLISVVAFIGYTQAIPTIDWGNCSVPVFPQSVIIRGNSMGIMSKSGSILNSQTQEPILDFKTSCAAWAPADAVFTYPSSSQVFARLNQQNIAIGDKIRLENCNGTVISIYREQILSTITTLGINLKYNIQDTSGNTYAETNSFNLFDTSMSVSQNNQVVSTFAMPFGEKIKKLWLGEQDATISFSSSSQPLANGEDRMIPIGLATYYLILASLSRDKNGQIVPPLCNTLYRGAIIGGVIGGVVVLFLIGWGISKKCKK